MQITIVQALFAMYRYADSERENFEM